MHDVTIDADVGEVQSGIPEALRYMGAVVRVSQLEASDYLVAHAIGVERKSILDLHFSIADQRLWSQLRSYRGVLERLYLLVEGVDLDDGKVSAAGVRGALLEIGDRGVTVVRSTSTTDSATWLHRLAARAQRLGTAPRPRARRYPRVRSPIELVAGIPGVGPIRARRLLDEFGSIGALQAAAHNDLGRVEGIGPALANTIHKALTGS